ncbi:MAG: ABC transporter permease [Luminiphilus sp.]|jgi:lipopolysaccharide transport system permease protein|nr:ABC transporter permease [Luminiphilus sp.]
MRIKGEARQYFLGYLWWLLEPMLYVAVFYFVFFTLLNSRQPDFLQFLMVGKLTFIWFSKSINQAANCIEINKGLVAQLRIPQALFPIATVIEGAYRQSVVFGFLLVFLLLSDYPLTPAWIWLMPVMLLNVILITGCAMAAALLVCWQRDFRLLIQLGTVFMLFVSGIFWDINTIQNTELVTWLMRLNPMAALIDAYRQILLHGLAPDAHMMLWALSEAVLLLTAMALCFQRFQFWMARRVISR